MNLEALREKLPEIRQWIDKTLEQHRARARSVASFGFRRLGSYYPFALLDSARVIEVESVPMPPLSRMGLSEFAEFERGDYRGITYMDTYFVVAAESGSESLHFHELVHVVQWRELGPDQFLLAYALGFLVGHGYRGNPLEVMAYELQDRFDRETAPFDAQEEIRRRIVVQVPQLLQAAAKTSGP